MTTGAILTGLFFIFIHFMTNKILPTERLKQLRWFSFSGGLAVSYVFVYVLPALHTEQQNIALDLTIFAMQSEIYFVGLVGVIMFYGSQLYVRQRENDNELTFWTQIFFYTTYNALVAYVVISAEVSGIQALFYSAAIGMHFIAVAHDMWREFHGKYDNIGRYMLAIGIFLGWGLGVFVEFTSLVQSIIFAFISGAMILNVFKYELPEDKHAHFPTFATGVVLYTTITLSLKFFFEW